VGGDQPVQEPARGEAGASFEDLFRAHEGDVIRLCRRMLASETAATDAAQEVFLRARRGYDSYDPRRPFRRWLLGVASHHCIDQLRRRNREARLFAAEDLDPADLQGPGASPLHLALDAEQRARVVAALDTLPHRYRLPLVLRYFEELDYEAIADVLGVSRNQVGTLLFRAKRLLRRSLEPGGAR
jgi:RNA polymerase sigma-70 factor (ECF subfamily)